ncbi:MAG: 4-hydroxy-tetrahydrodipicolinate reductase [Dehalococcoidia bacterium]|nr:4-hydroxy-tetrahydrodipicolinate reductase [Dehalococcoidia bacterium]MCB9485135.1 4-hydroxy-tetrahydrodipicolinate reductase [Thermoflexaceae bacterium]
MSNELRVAISGSGKMGRQVAAAVMAEADMFPTGYLDTLQSADVVEGLTVYRDAAAGLDAMEPDVVVDFTNAVWTPALAEVAMARGVRLVIGTTGLSSAFVERLATDCAERKVGGLVASNFALSAVLMMEFAKQAARLFDHAEIIELHHNQKVDAPSGTAKTTAEMMLLARGRDFEHADTERFTVDGARGGDLGGIAIHSVRLPGLVAHQEVIFGSLGQTLTIRQDSTGRDSFMPGVLLAVRKVMHLDRLVVGLDGILGLDRE